MKITFIDALGGNNPIAITLSQKDIEQAIKEFVQKKFPMQEPTGIQLKVTNIAEPVKTKNFNEPIEIVAQIELK